MENYVEILRPHTFIFGKDIIKMHAMGGGEKSPLFPFLNYAAMTATQRHIKTNLKYEDYDECKRKGMECMMEHIKCLATQNAIINGLDITEIEYYREEGETLPFTGIKTHPAYIAANASHNGLTSYSLHSDIVKNNINLDVYAYFMMAALYKTANKAVGRIAENCSKYLQELPTPREIGRMIKETPQLPMPHNAMSTTITRSDLRLKMLHKSFNDGEYVYGGTMKGRDGKEIEYTVEHFSKHDNALKRTTVYSQRMAMDITREDLGNPLFQKSYMEMTELNGIKLARAVSLYEKNLEWNKQLIQTITKQHQHITELLDRTKWKDNDDDIW